DLGATIEELGNHSLRITASGLKKANLDPELCKAIRASILLAGPLLARLGHVEVPQPGGDVIGRRRVDTHFQAVDALGAPVDFNGLVKLHPERLKGEDFWLDEASVPAPETAVRAAVLAKGPPRLRNAASEPHVQELCQFLNTLGAQISGIGSNALTIEGVE